MQRDISLYRQSARQTGRQRSEQKDRQRDRQTESQPERVRETDRETEKRTDNEKSVNDRLTVSKRDSFPFRQTDKHIKTDIHKLGQTVPLARQTNKLTAPCRLANRSIRYFSRIQKIPGN